MCVACRFDILVGHRRVLDGVTRGGVCRQNGLDRSRSPRRVPRTEPGIARAAAGPGCEHQGRALPSGGRFLFNLGDHQCRQDDILLPRTSLRVPGRNKGWSHGRRHFFSRQGSDRSQAPHLDLGGRRILRAVVSRDRRRAGRPGSSSRSSGWPADRAGGTRLIARPGHPLIRRPCSAGERRVRPSWRIPLHAQA